MRIGLIFHQFGGYHLARLRAAHQAAQARGWAVEGIEMHDPTAEHPWGALAADPDLTLHRLGGRPGGLIALLEDRAFDALAIPGWGFDYSRKALAWRRRNRRPAILMSESKADDAPRTWWKEWLKSRLVRQFSSALVGGRRHEDYLAGLGMGRDRIFRGYDIVDNGHFAAGADAARNDPAAARARWPSIPERPYFLCASRFVERKNLDTLLRAYAVYLAETGRDRAWGLALTGSGPGEDRLRRLARELGIEDRAIFPGFVSYEEMPAWYGLAGGFVHPARSEQWGLVVNEAMAAGLAAMVSRTCGCFPELIAEGETGLGFDPDRAEELTGAMSRIAEDAGLRSRLGSAARTRVMGNFAPGDFGRGLVRAMDAALRASEAK